MYLEAVYLGECVPVRVCIRVAVYLSGCVPEWVYTLVDVYLEAVYLGECVPVWVCTQMGVYLEAVHLGGCVPGWACTRMGVLPGIQGCPRAHLPTQGILCLGSTTLPSFWLKGGTSWPCCFCRG